MGAYGEHSSRLRNFEGFKLVTNLRETKEAKCKICSELRKVERGGGRDISPPKEVNGDWMGEVGCILLLACSQVLGS